MTLTLGRLRNICTASLLRRNVGMTLGHQVLATLAQFLLVVLIARKLGPAGNGFYAIAVLLPIMLTNFLNFGVGPATVYYVCRGEFGVRQAIHGNLCLALIITSAGIVFAVPILAVWSDNLFPGIPRSLIYLGLAGFPPALLISYLNTILQGLEDFKAFNATILLPPYVNLVSVFVVLYVFKLGVFAAIVSHIVGQLAGLVVVAFCLLRHIANKTHSDTNQSVSAYSHKTLSYGWKAHLSNILTFVNYRADIFLVNFFLSPAAVGIYAIAVQIAERLWILSTAASIVLFPRLSKMHDTPGTRFRLTNKAFVIISSITGIAGGFVALLLCWLISPIFGEEYVDVLPVFFWLLPGILAGAGARIQANCIAASGKPEWNMYVSLGVVVINILGNILLIPEYGIVGAAWATSVAYIFNAIIKFWLVKKTMLQDYPK